jgi:hypothetical protein
MARRQARLPAQTRRFYLYDQAVARYLGGFPVKTDETGARFLMLTDEQAGYWMRTGVVGKVRLEALEGEARRQVNQISGGRLPMTEEDRARGRVREEQVMTMGAFGMPGKKVRVATRRNAVQDPATHIDNVIKHGGMVTEAAITEEVRRNARRMSTQVVFSSSEGMNKSERSNTFRPPSSKG